MFIRFTFMRDRPYCTCMYLADFGGRHLFLCHRQYIASFRESFHNWKAMGYVKESSIGSMEKECDFLGSRFHTLKRDCRFQRITLRTHSLEFFLSILQGTFLFLKFHYSIFILRITYSIS